MIDAVSLAGCSMHPFDLSLSLSVQATFSDGIDGDIHGQVAFCCAHRHGSRIQKLMFQFGFPVPIYIKSTGDCLQITHQARSESDCRAGVAGQK